MSILITDYNHYRLQSYQSYPSTSFLLDPKMPGNVSFEIDILPQFIAKKQLGAYVTDTQYYYITNMQSLKDFESAASAKNVFIDPRFYRI